ncbi:MAG: prepilin-type N-terminal cleavage/methylation domain-containing protein [Parcubacteria group bacterium]
MSLNKYLKNNKGFTLVEVLAALLVLSIGLIGAYSLISYNFVNATRIKNNVIASGLVQEGMEVVRNIRDTAWLEGIPMSAVLTDGTYKVQWDSISLDSGSPTQVLKNDEGVYQYISGADTIFSRIITVETESNIEKKITVNVDWEDRSGVRNVNAELHLFNWL